MPNVICCARLIVSLIKLGTVSLTRFELVIALRPIGFNPIALNHYATEHLK